MISLILLLNGMIIDTVRLTTIHAAKNSGTEKENTGDEVFSSCTMHSSTTEKRKQNRLSPKQQCFFEMALLLIFFLWVFLRKGINRYPPRDTPCITLFFIVSGFGFIIALVACIVFFQLCCFSSFTSIRSTSMGRTSRFVLGQCKTSLKSLQIWEAAPPKTRSFHRTIKRSSYFGLVARRG